MRRTVCQGCQRLRHVAEMILTDIGWRCAFCVEDVRITHEPTIQTPRV